MERFQGETCLGMYEFGGVDRHSLYSSEEQSGGTGWRSLPVWRSHWKPVLQRREKSGCGFGLPC